MTITPILAEDISPFVLVIVIVPAILVLTFIFSISLSSSRRTGRPLKTELLSRLVPILAMILISVVAIRIRGGDALPSTMVVALPVAAALLGVYMRRRKPPQAPPTETKDIPPSPPRPARPFSPISLPLMVAAWFLFFVFLIICCAKYLQLSWTLETWMLASVSVLCLILIPLQIIAYFRNK
jgi:hypothetical protein